MRRRDLIKAAAGSAVGWPLLARAQQAERTRRVAFLTNRAAADPQGQAVVAAFKQSLQQSGWSEKDVLVDTRWAENDVDRARKYGAELVALAPDVLVAAGTLAVTELQRLTRTLPIVFVGVSDPVAAGVVANLARPGGNATGFMNFEYSFGGKWLELLKQIAPSVLRVGVLRNPTIPAGIGQFSAVQATAQSLGVEVNPITAQQDVGEMEHALIDFANAPGGGLIVTGSASGSALSDRVIALAVRLKLPAVYPYRYMAANGGLMSYGPNYIDPYRRAAGYVDRILKGEKPADLPVQAPTKYELVINAKTAKALGLIIPQPLQASADEVIE